MVFAEIFYLRQFNSVGLMCLYIAVTRLTVQLPIVVCIVVLNTLANWLLYIR